MTSRHALAAALAIFGIQGCVVYDHDRRGDGCGDQWVDDCGSGWDGQDPSTPGDTEEPALQVELTLSPAVAEQGQTFIGSLVVTGDVDNTAVAGMQFIDDSVTVLAAEVRDTELLVTIAVAGDAVPGSFDAIVELVDLQPVLFGGALEVLEASGSVVDDPGDTGDTHDDPCGDTGL